MASSRKSNSAARASQPTPMTESETTEAEKAARALVNKGIALAKAGHGEDAVAVADEVVGRYGERPEASIAEQVAKALICKGVTLEEVGRAEDAVAACEEIVQRYGERPEAALAVLVIEALIGKGGLLGKVGPPEKEIAVYDEVVRRYGERPEADVVEWVASALNNKGITLAEAGHADEAVVVFDEVVRRYGDHAAANEVVRRHGERPEASIAEQVANALNNKGITLAKVGQFEDAVAACEQVVRRYGGHVAAGAGKQVAEVLIDKGATLGYLSHNARHLLASMGFPAVAPLVAVLDAENEQIARGAALTLKMIADEADFPPEYLFAALESAVPKLERLCHKFLDETPRDIHAKFDYPFLSALKAIANFSPQAADAVADVEKMLARAGQEAHFERDKLPEQLKRERGSVPSPEEKIKELFVGLPDDPRERLKAISALFTAVRKEAAQELQPAVATLIEQAITLPYDQMVTISQLINQVLNDAQHAIRNPETGLPAKLKPLRPRPSSSARHLHLRDTRAAADGQQHCPRVDELPPGSIELIPTVPEAESTQATQHRPSGGRSR
jgi:tetratricopeptide (TPR) repeat protein